MAAVKSAFICDYMSGVFYSFPPIASVKISTRLAKLSVEGQRKFVLHAQAMKAANTLPSPINHIFVDFENVHEVDPAVIGNKAVKFTLLVGPRQSKLEVPLVEQLLKHPDSAKMVRLTSSGRNALDFALAYYVGRAVVADPTGSFHIVSKDKGYDPLIAHLQTKHIRARRHDSFDTLDFAAPAKLPTPNPPAAAPKLKAQSRSKIQPSILDERTTKVLEHLRMPSSTRPKYRKKLVSFVVACLGHKITEAEALNVVEKLRRAGHLAIGEKGAVTYRL